MEQFADEHEREAVELRHEKAELLKQLQTITTARDEAIACVRRLEVYADNFVSMKDEIQDLKTELKSWREQGLPPLINGSWKETAILNRIELRDLQKGNLVQLRNIHRLTLVNAALRAALLNFMGRKQVDHIETEANKLSRRAGA